MWNNSPTLSRPSRSLGIPGRALLWAWVALMSAPAAVDPMRVTTPAFQVITSREGLPQNSAMDLLYDSSGRLWVATQDGVATFDGQAWRAEAMPERKFSNFLRCMVLDVDGGLWFGRQDGGVAHLKSGRWDRPEGLMGAAGTRVNALLACQGAVWAATTRQGLGRFDGQHWTMLGANEGLPAAPMQCLASAEGAGLWVGTGQGLVLLENNRVARTELPGVSVESLLRLKDGGLLAGTARGLFQQSQGAWKPLPLPMEIQGRSIHALAQTRAMDGSDVLWVGTGGEGLASRDSAGWRIFTARNGLPSGAIWSLLPVEAKAGTEALWIGTDAGLVHLQFGQWQSLGRDQGLADPSVYALAWTKGKGMEGSLWLGTRSSGVARIEPSRVRFYTPKDGLPDVTVFSLLEWPLEGGAAVLYAGTQAQGLAQFAGGRWRPASTPVTLRHANIRQLRETQDTEGRRVLWLMSGGAGLWRRTGETWESVTMADGLPTNNIHSALETLDSLGGRTLWIGTESAGLARRRAGKLKIFTTQEGLPNNTVMSLAETHWGGGHQLWAGTEGGGLAWCDPDLEEPVWHVLSETTDPPLPNNTVYQVQVDGRERLYVFTNRGVARVAGTLGALHIEAFNTDSGLPSNEFNGGASMKDPLGRIWGGSISGAAVFDPAQELPAPAVSRLLLEQVQVNGETREFPQGVRLGHRERRLDFRFALLNFFRTSETRYQSQLLGLEEAPSAWSPEAHREFPGLGAGRYVFRVWARNYRGQVAGPVDLAFEIHPAPWRTVWAYGLYLLAMAGVAWAAVRTRLGLLQRKNEELEDRIRIRTHEIAAAKDHIESQNRQIARLMESSSLAQRDIISWSRAIAEELAQTIGATSIGIYTVQGEELRALGESATRIPTLQELQAKPYLNPKLDRRKNPVPVVEDRRGELSIPVEGPSGEILGGMVLSGPFAWGEPERRLVGVFAAQLGAILELQKTRRNLSAARQLQTHTRDSLREKGVALLQICPTCQRCYDESVRECAWDQTLLEAPRVLPYLIENRYQLLRLLGEGGMGLVFEAKDLRLDREVALKLIKPELYGIPEIRARFTQEARALASIEHPGVISIFDSGELEDGSAIMVMELLKGVDLGTIIARHGAGTPAQVARLLRQGGAGLAAAHRAGVIHRDIKPANIFLIQGIDGFQVKILDFGLAKPLAAEGGVTQTGMVVGTPQYMSPEQVRGHNLDARSDVYAFAANGYEALTGHRLIVPHAVGDVFSLIARGEHQPLAELVPGLPKRVGHAFEAALSVDVAGRPWDIDIWVSGFVDDLDGMANRTPGWPDIPASGFQPVHAESPPTGLMPDSGTG